MGEALQQVIFELCRALLWPVVLLLLAGFGQVLMQLGELLVEAWRRRLNPEHLTDPAQPPPSMARRRGIARWGEERARDAGASPWLILDRTEAALAARVDRARLWVRLGPVLGLAGTLIPLGPALLALSAQDVATLSGQLVLAFGTTVVGLLAGGLAWIVASHWERWYRLDLAEVRHALERQEA